MLLSVRHIILVTSFALIACGKKQEAPFAAAPPVNSMVEVACTYAPSQSKVVAAVATSAGGAGTAAAAIAQAAGLTAVLHSSGAYIFTGSAGYIAGTLGTAVVGPVIVGISVVVGSVSATVEVLCVPKNHPELSRKVEAASAEFYLRAKESVAYTVAATAPIAAELRSSAIQSGSEALEYANRKSVELAEALAK